MVCRCVEKVVPISPLKDSVTEEVVKENRWSRLSWTSVHETGSRFKGEVKGL